MQGPLADRILLCCDFFDSMHTRSMQNSNTLHCAVIGVTIIALQGQGLLDLSCISQLQAEAWHMSLHDKPRRHLNVMQHCR